MENVCNTCGWLIVDDCYLITRLEYTIYDDFQNKFERHDFFCQETLNFSRRYFAPKSKHQKHAFVYILHLKTVTLRNQVRLKEKSYAKFEAASQAYPFHGFEKTIQDAKWPRALWFHIHGLVIHGTAVKGREGTVKGTALRPWIPGLCE